MANYAGTIQVKWLEGRSGFAELLRNAVAAKFGVPISSLYQEFMQPIERLYSRLSSRIPLLRSGEMVRVDVSFSYSRENLVARDVALNSPDAKSAPPEPQPRSPSAIPVKFPLNTSGAVLISLLESASAHGNRTAITDFVVTQQDVEIRAWRSLPDGGTGQPGAAISAQEAVTEFMSLMQASKGQYPKIYTARFEVLEGRWSFRRTELVGEVLPLPTTDPAAPEEGASEDYEDEAETIIADIKAGRQLILTAAAEMIAEQDPTRLDNILLSVAPFAIGRLGKLRKLAGLRKLKAAEVLARIKSPKAVQLIRPGRYHVPTGFNPKLAERALELRKTKYGVEFKDFRQTNVSAWHVKIDGKDQIFDSGNIPASVLNQQHGKGSVDVGIHSEGLIAEELRKLEMSGKKVQVHQIYTERKPCPKCAELLTRYSEAPVFHSIRPGNGSKAEKLMEAYGVAAP